MHHAATGGPQTFAYLLNLGLDPYIQDYFRDTSLWDACRGTEQYPSSVALISNSNLDFTRVDTAVLPIWGDDSLGAVQMLVRRAGSEAVSALVNFRTKAGHPKSGGRPLCIAILSNAPSICSFLIKVGADLELESEGNGTPLILASSMGILDKVKMFVFAGAKIISRKVGRSISALQAAIKFPHIVRWLLVERFFAQGKINESAHDCSEINVES
jgi:hypothetical protein